MDFSHLDDPAPPLPTPERTASTLARGKKRQQIRRVLTTAVGAAASVSLVVTAIALRGVEPDARVVAVTGSTVHSRTTIVNQPGSSVPTTRPTDTTALDPNIWVSVSIKVNQAQVKQGHEVTGTIMFTNHRDKRVNFPEKGCLGKFAVVVTRPDAEVAQSWTTECAIPGFAGHALPHSKYLAVPTGITVVPFTATTTYSQCSDGPSLAPTLRCLPNQGGPPPLPVGAAVVRFITESESPHLEIPKPTPITISGEGVAPPEVVTMPNVVGMTLPDATSTLFELSFYSVCAREVAGITSELGVVTSQSVAPGTRVRPRKIATVELTVTGPPNVINRSMCSMT